MKALQMTLVALIFAPIFMAVAACMVVAALGGFAMLWEVLTWIGLV